MYTLQSQTLFRVLANSVASQQIVAILSILGFAAIQFIATSVLVSEIRSLNTVLTDFQIQSFNFELAAFEKFESIDRTLKQTYDIGEIYNDELQFILFDILEATTEIELVINADELNITLELDLIEEYVVKIYEQNEEIFNSEDGWGSSIKAKLEEADEILGAVSDSFDILQGIIETVSAIVEGVQQSTLAAISTTLTAILEELSAGAFNLKVLEAIAEADFSIEAAAFEVGAFESPLMASAAVLLDVCESAFGEGPIACEGAQLAEFIVTDVTAEGFISELVSITPIFPFEKKNKDTKYFRQLNSISDSLFAPFHSTTTATTSSPCLTTQPPSALPAPPAATKPPPLNGSLSTAELCLESCPLSSTSTTSTWPVCP